MRSRLRLPDPDRLDPQQRAVHESIVATRGNVDGPFLAWMHSPEFAGFAEKLGAFCRYRTSLGLAESELLILCVAAHFDCIGERQIHEPIALAAGIDPRAVEAIRARRAAELTGERMVLLHDLARQLLANNRIEADLYRRAAQTLGERTLVEAVGVIGYYALVAMTLNAFEMAQGD